MSNLAAGGKGSFLGAARQANPRGGQCHRHVMEGRACRESLSFLGLEKYISTMLALQRGVCSGGSEAVQNGGTTQASDGSNQRKL